MPEPFDGSVPRQIATMITWLERRHAGIDPAVEKIMLAAD